MLDRYGRHLARHPLGYVVGWAVATTLFIALAVFGVHGQGLFDRLTSGAPTVPGSQSEQASQILTETSTSGDVISLAVEGVDPSTTQLATILANGRTALAKIDGVNPQKIFDPTALPGGTANPAGAPQLAKSGNGLLMSVELEPNLTDAQSKAAHAQVDDELDAIGRGVEKAFPGSSYVISSTDRIVHAIVDQVERDLTTGEAIALPISLFVMVLVFGGFLAASMPLIGAIASIGGALATLLGFSYVMDLDSAVVNVVTVLGLGLSIDYGLLIVSRFREQLRRAVEKYPDSDQSRRRRRRRGDPAVQEALGATMSTAGRTVTFSAITVAISTSSLLVFSPDILRAFGAAGVSVIVIALLTALTLVPALIALSGRRLARPSSLSHVPGVRVIVARLGDVAPERGFFSALTTRVQRHPWWVIGGVVTVLAVLTVPLFGIQLRNSAVELLPKDSDQRDYVQLITTEYPALVSPPIQVVAETTLANSPTFVNKIAKLNHVGAVAEPRAQDAYVVIGVTPDNSSDATAQKVVKEIRGLDPGYSYYVGGKAANEIDFTAALAAGAPWAMAIVVLATFVLMFLATGSVLIPLKALIINVFSLGASLGILVWAFQDSHLAGVLDFVSTGGIETYILALVIAFGFGLAMDYEMFLLSRIKEAHDAGMRTNEAVRVGLQRSGRIITSAALIVVLVFAGFVAGKLLVIKETGFALGVAVALDATLVRCLLVPATMTVLNEYNWWAPRPLRKLYARLAFKH